MNLIFSIIKVSDKNDIIVINLFSNFIYTPNNYYKDLNKKYLKISGIF